MLRPEKDAATDHTQSARGSALAHYLSELPELGCRNGCFGPELRRGQLASWAARSASPVHSSLS
jgi:hypothetical protein